MRCDFAQPCRDGEAFPVIPGFEKRAAVGAQVRIQVDGKKRLSFVNGGNSFAGQSSSRVHFGLGTADKIECAEIRWPSGHVETFRNIGVDRLNKLQEGTSGTK